MKENRFLFMPKVSLKSDRVTLYNEVLYIDRENNLLKTIAEIKKTKEKNAKKNETTVKKAFHNFEISGTAQKKIKEKVNWLYVMAKSRYMKTYNGKEIFNFKINFLTLTLPSKQIHNTAQITNDCFNQFLTEMRDRVKLENYVWRLEFQQNGNVHYHIVTDCYIDYFFALKTWNRIINKLNYVNVYKEKFSKMSLHEYICATSKYDNSNYQSQLKRYAKGKSEKWNNPPTVDVKVCTNNKAISNYISKYFSKKTDNKTKCNELDNENNSFSIRLWYCSRSLSRLQSINDYKENIKIDWFELLKGVDKVKQVICDYAVCLFFDIGQMPSYIKGLIYKEFREYANTVSYNSA
jgi:3-phenylpropionate/cinnamic acid dioxygenase small subunit